MSTTFTIMGCGNSAGVPTIGNYWGQCNPNEPRNRRTRASACVRSENTTLVIDTGPDFKEQVNCANIDFIDAVLYTHAHSDHVQGIDELRVLRLRHKQEIDIYGDHACIEELHEKFRYMFINQHEGIYPKVLTPYTFKDTDYGNKIRIGELDVIPFVQDHGTCESIGYRIGDLAYSTDVVGLDDAALKALEGVKTWIVDGAGYKMERNKVHFNFKQVFEFYELVKPENLILTHLTPAMDYATMVKDLPEHMQPAYDGMTFDCLTGKLIENEKNEYVKKAC